MAQLAGTVKLWSQYCREGQGCWSLLEFLLAGIARQLGCDHGPVCSSAREVGFWILSLLTLVQAALSQFDVGLGQTPTWSHSVLFFATLGA